MPLVDPHLEPLLRHLKPDQAQQAGDAIRSQPTVVEGLLANAQAWGRYLERHDDRDLRDPIHDALFQAAARGDGTAVDAFLLLHGYSGALLHWSSVSGALTEAAARGHLDVVRCLHAVIQPYQQNAGRDILYQAAVHGHAAVARWALERFYPAAPVPKDVVMQAVTQGHASVAAMVVRADTDYDTRIAAMKVALQRDHPEVVAVLTAWCPCLTVAWHLMGEVGLTLSPDAAAAMFDRLTPYLTDDEVACLSQGMDHRVPKTRMTVFSARLLSLTIPATPETPSARRPRL